MSRIGVQSAARSVSVVGAVAVGLLLGGWWWTGALVAGLAGALVPEAPRAAVVQAGASLALVAGAVAEDRLVAVPLVAFVCFATLELHAATASSGRREPSDFAWPVVIILGGTVWAGVVAAIAIDVGTAAVPVIAGAVLIAVALVASRPLR